MNGAARPPAGPGTPARPEILAPAGSMQALTAAVRCGADAVYLGGGGFNARRNAQNFDAASLREAAAFCHARGVKVHFTLNTLVRQDELPAALALAEEACAMGADALIVQDLGLARAVRAAAPDMPLHASTQLSCHTPAGVRELAALGFSRVVLAREMSREEIAACAGQGAELEIFVHGALCMCVSGQCLLSAMLGGRSGNRGLCAQPCRLPFAAGRSGSAGGERLPRPDEAALSLRDLSLREHVKELASLGVCSLKIEGRMKRPEYVAAATAAVAAARDGRPEEETRQLIEDLQSVFSRSGFTDGYYTGRRGKPMFGVRRKEDVTAAAPVLGRLGRLYEKEAPRVPVTLSLTMRRGEPLRLTAADREGHAVQAAGPTPEPALRRPLDAERAAAQLSKTGGTPFSAAVSCTVEEGLTAPAAVLNALRREALDSLLVLRAAPVPVPFDPARLPPDRPAGCAHPPLPSCPSHPPQPTRPALAARFADRRQVPADPEADALIFPLHTGEEALRFWSARLPVGVELPRGLFGREEQAAALCRQAAAAGARFALCGNIGALELAREAGLAPAAGFGMNLFNAGSLQVMAQRGVRAAVLSQELTFRQMDFAARSPIPVGILAYGRQPLMLMRCCPCRAGPGCAGCGGRGALTDRKGVRFPVACEGAPGADGCAELLNSAPLYLADRLEELPALDFLLLHFTDETPEQAAAVLRAYRDGGKPPAAFTRGLYRRGVE